VETPDAPVRTTAKRTRCGLSAQEELLVTELRGALNRLEQRRAEIRAREAALKALETQVMAEIVRLQQIQAAVGQRLDQTDVKADEATVQRESERRKRITQLAGILKKMKPAAAAPIIAQQSDDVSVGVLETLGERPAALIMAQLPPNVSARLARKLVAQPLSKGE